MLVAVLVFEDVGQVLRRRVVVARATVERAEREIDERRRVGHQVQNALALCDDAADLEAVPALLFVAQDFVGGDVEVEDVLHVLLLGALDGAPDEVDDRGEEDDDGQRYAHHAEHRHDDDDGDQTLRRFLTLSHNSSDE